MPRENYSSGYVEHYEQADEENPFLKFSSQISRKPSAQSPEVVNAKVKAFAVSYFFTNNYGTSSALWRASHEPCSVLIN